MKRMILLAAAALLAACTAAPAMAVPNSFIITQRNSNDTGNILRTLDNPPSDGILIWQKSNQMPAYLVVGNGLSVTNGVLSATATSTTGPAYAFDYGEPVARSLALNTSYQALDPSKPADITVSTSCSASLSLSTGSTCTLQVRTSPAAGLNCTNGTLYAVATNANTGTLTVGLGLSQRVGGPVSVKLRSGSFFILCPVSGTFTVDAAVEQTAG